jgi:predicted secreted hydrolase
MRRRLLLASGMLPFLTGPSLADANNAKREEKTKPRVFQQPKPDTSLVLPRDHGPHPDFRNEWWYFTGWFKTGNDMPGDEHTQELGIQITFFRSAPDVDLNNPSRFNPAQLLIAHVAVAHPKKGILVHDQIALRAQKGEAEISGSSIECLNISLPKWKLRSKDGSAWYCNIAGHKIGLELSARQTQAPWLQGDNGFSRKGPDPIQSSHYITLPHMQTEGFVTLDGRKLPIQGKFWMDHEWSSTVLAPEAQGWDWVGLLGEDGSSLMAFQIRNKTPGKPPVWTHACLRQANGRTQNFKNVQFNTLKNWKSAKTGTQYPVSQSIQLDGNTYILTPLFDDQELDARMSSGTLYWEGAVQVEMMVGEFKLGNKSETKPQAWGKGYLEMTGYDRPMSL